jgi:hypothetical protein
MDPGNKYYFLDPRNPQLDKGAADIVAGISDSFKAGRLSNDRIKELYYMLYTVVKYPKDENDVYWLSLRQLFIDIKDTYQKIKNKEAKARAELSPIHIINITTPELLTKAREKLKQTYDYCSKMAERGDITDASNIFELFNTLFYSTQSFPPSLNIRSDFSEDLVQFKNEQFKMRPTVGEWRDALREKIDKSDLAYIRSLDAKQGGRRRQKSRQGHPATRSKGRRSKSKGRRSRSKSRVK